MSKHHRAQHWTTHAPKLREKIAARLPLPCIECGNLVTREQRWHVGHITAASQGGKPTVQNTGPAHASCNLKSGGRLGAAMTNGRRRAAQDIRPW